MASNRVGIIPAAGAAKRFGGVFKELLPVGESMTLLSRAVDTLEMIPVDTTIIVTNPQKIAAHSVALQGRNVEFVTQMDKPDIWGAIASTLNIDADWYYFIMPDTMQEQGRFPELPDHQFMLGLFETFDPQNYGVLLNGEIVDKSASLAPPQTAWGTLVWSRECVELWKKYLPEISDYTQAFNMAMEQLGWGTYSLAWYFDCGTFQRYKRALAHV